MAEKLVLIGIALFALHLAYVLGTAIGSRRQRNFWSRHMEVGHDYRRAVDDLDRWCGHSSPHARLIAAHLLAAGEGHSRNAGTPHSSEPCTIDGLREQLRRLDAAQGESKGGTPHG